MNDSINFLKKNKAFFVDKGLEANNIVLLKGKDEIVTDSSTLANFFNNYFINITNILKLKEPATKI